MAEEAAKAPALELVALPAIQQRILVVRSAALERLELIVHLSADETALAGVTYAGAAAEACGDVASLGEVEQGSEREIPAHRQVAAAELNQRPGPGGSRRQMGRARLVREQPREVNPWGPKTSVRTRSGGTPRAARAAATSSMNAAGPQI